MACIAVVALSLAAAELEAADEPRDGELRALLQFASKAVQKVQRFSCMTRDYVTMDDPDFLWESAKSREVVEKSVEGYALTGEYKVIRDRISRRARYEGREFAIRSDGQAAYYMVFNGAYDGKLYRTYVPHAKSGQQLNYRNELEPRRSVDAFLGDGLGGFDVIGANLSYWLEQPDGWYFESPADAPEPRIARRYKTDTYASEMRLHLTLSPEHDYLPKSFETYWCETESMCQQYRVEKFAEVDPERTWVPVRGWFQGFYRDPVYPEGVTKESYAQMSDEAKKDVDPLFRFRAAPLDAPRLIVIDTDSLRINQPLQDNEFVLEFPEGSVIFDERAQEALLGGTQPIPKKTSQQAAPKRPVWLWLVVVNVLFVLVVWISMKRRRVT